MSRHTTHGLPRESIWPSAVPSSDHLAHLEDCISATEGCVATLSSCLIRLEPGTRDLPRLSKVLKNEHRFLVLPHTTIQTHLTALSSALAPQINALMVRADDLVEHERERIRTLEQTLKLLQSATLPQSDLGDSSTKGQGQDELEEDGGGSKLDALEMASLTVLQRRKVMMLRNKRERLEREKIKLGLTEGEGPLAV